MNKDTLPTRPTQGDGPEPTFRQSAVLLYPPRPYSFIVREERRRRPRYVIEWLPHSQDGTQTNLYDFLQWAGDWGASYNIVSYMEGSSVKWQFLDLQNRAGEHFGEYERGLLYDLGYGRAAGAIFRRFHSVNKLVQHALDGLPYPFYRALLLDSPDLQIFRVETKDGVFSHSLHTWYVGSRYGSKPEALLDLAIRVQETGPDMEQASLL